MEMKEFFNTLENINSKKLCNMINTFREEEGNRAKLGHDKLLRRIKNEIDSLSKSDIDISRQFRLDVYADEYDRQQPCYVMDKRGVMQILIKESAFVRYKICEYIEQLEKENEELRNFVIDKFSDSDISLTKVFGDIISAKIINEWLISNGYCVRMRHPNGICDNPVPTKKIPSDFFKVVERKYGPRDDKGPHTELETRFNVKGMFFILDLLKKNNMM
jgi:hypothetical protein